MPLGSAVSCTQTCVSYLLRLATSLRVLQRVKKRVGFAGAKGKRFVAHGGAIAPCVGFVCCCGDLYNLVVVHAKFRSWGLRGHA